MQMLPPGSVIGILGGGQLGRMLAMAAAELGLSCRVYDPDEASPAADVCAGAVHAPWEDTAALDRFAATVDVVSYEFENVPLSAVRHLSAVCPVRPSVAALETAQDRLTEKDFLKNLGIATAPYAAVDSPADLPTALKKIGFPAVIKTRRLGYDGKGQCLLKSPADAPPAGFWSNTGAIVEGWVDFQSEGSVMVCRGMDGAFCAWEPPRNEHRDHILHRSTVPGGWTAAQIDEITAIGRRIVEALDYVGVMGVEFFAPKSGALLVNELAPRVHNSGHWTPQACRTGQFEQHIRAICGWPLGDASRLHDAKMINLIGGDADGWLKLAAGGGSLHLYGKKQARPGRKMGHVTRIYPLDSPGFGESG